MKKDIGFKITNEVFKEMLVELWEGATFNPQIMDLLQKIVETSANKAKKIENLTLPNERVMFELSTLRNRHLINYEEQNKLRSTIVVFFGLSAGSHAATTWMMESRADVIKISDPDTISPSNLNRLRLGWNTVGKLKVNVTRNILHDINPNCDVITEKRIGATVIEKLILDNPPVSVIVDAMDDIESKVFIRKLAKMKRIPVIMTTDVGDNIKLDIERYDQDPTLKFFNGRVKNIEKINFSGLGDSERRKLIIEIVGLDQHSERMLESLLSIGQTITTWPQLAATATIAGGVTTTAIKKIVLGENLLSGRYDLSLDDILVKDSNSLNKSKKREILKKQIMEKFTT